jgi:hypothetical protein
MAKYILLEELHLTVVAPRGLPPTEYEVIVQTVTSAPFMARLRYAVRRVFRREPLLNQAKVRLSR